MDISPPEGRGLPSRRRKIVGETYEGERLELELSVAKKLYRCPACRGYIGIGQEHVFVRYPDADSRPGTTSTGTAAASRRNSSAPWPGSVRRQPHGLAGADDASYGSSVTGIRSTLIREPSSADDS